MTIPSFGNYAPKPDLAGAYLGGARLAQARQDSSNEMQLGQQRLAQAAQQAQQEIQLAQQKIAAQQAQAQMELQAKQEVAQQQMMRQQQELQIEKSYKDAQLGLEQRRVEEAEKIVQLKVGEAARKFQAQQAFQKESQELISGGMDADKAFSQTALKYGPMLGIPGSAYSRAGIKAPGGGADFGGASPVAGLPEGYRQVQTGPSSRQIIRIPESVDVDAEATPIRGAPGKAMLNGKVITVREEPEVVAARKRLTSLESAQEKDIAGKRAIAKEEDGETLKGGTKALASTYKARAKEIEGLKQELKSDKPAEKASQFEGKRVRSKKTGKLGRVIDGEFVPDEE